MRKFVYLSTIMMLVACTSECDKQGFSLNVGNCSPKASQPDGSTSRQQVTNNSGTTITTERHDTPGLPNQVYVEGHYVGQAGLIRVPRSAESEGLLMFTASMSRWHFDPEISAQLNFSESASFSVISPDTTGCALTNKRWGTAGQTNAVIQFTAPDTEACVQVYSAMKLTGFQVQFTDVPANSGGKINSVIYLVRP